MQEHMPDMLATRWAFCWSISRCSCGERMAAKEETNNKRTRNKRGECEDSHIPDWGREAVDLGAAAGAMASGGDKADVEEDEARTEVDAKRGRTNDEAGGGDENTGADTVDDDVTESAGEEDRAEADAS